MNSLLVFLAVAAQPVYALNGAQSAQDQTRDSVITKVVQMLAEEKDKIAIDLKAERAQMDEYLNFCHREQDEKNYQIGTANRKIDDLSALIEDNTAQIDALDEEIVDLGTEMAKLVASQEKEDERRANGTAEFKQREMEQTIMVEELNNLAASLEKQMEAMTTPPPVELQQVGSDVEAFIQKDASNDELLSPGFWASAYQDAKAEFADRQKRTSEAKVQKMTREEARTRAASWLQHLGTNNLDDQTILNLRTTIGAALSAVVDAQFPGSSEKAFVQEQDDEDPPATQKISAAHYDMAKKNNEANLEAFKGLKGKAEQALQRERDIESEDQHNYMLDKQARVQEMNVNEDKTDEAKGQRASLTEEKAEAQKELGNIQLTKEADMKYLKTLITECTTGSEAWDKRQQEASDEQAAIMKAMEILSSRVKVFLHREGLLQVEHKQPAQEAGVDKAQMQDAKVRQTLINHFRNLGTKLHSLSMLNMVSAASVQPMDKVKGLIKELISKLQKEAADAASTHAWCEEENKKNKVAKEKASDKLKQLEIRIEKATTKKAELSDNIEALTEQIAEIDAADAEATKIRTEENTNFKKAEADFKEAASAVLDAIDALKDYYGDSVFLETESQIETTTTSPIRFQAPDLGGAKKDSAGGILSILDMMATNFAKTVSELQSTEREKKKAYDKMTNDNAVSKASKEAEIKGATSEIASLTVAVGHASDDKAMKQDEMNALLEYIDKLKPTCVGTVMPYAERKAKREAEIEGLKQAMNLLEETQGTLGMVSFLQVRKHQLL